MKMVGNNNALSFYYKDQKRKGLHFVPGTPGNAMYTLRCTFLPLEANMVLSAVNLVDYDLMHEQMGLPAKGILRKTIDHTTGFPPNILFPNDNPVCRGCAEGKMHSKSYPDSQTRATRQFGKIHLDLKQFPIKSYHKFKYFMSFFDDFSYRAWTVLLKTKRAANSAMQQIIAMVKNQYPTTIVEWMIDGGGEFNLTALGETLKNNRIKVL